MCSRFWADTSVRPYGRYYHWAGRPRPYIANCHVDRMGDISLFAFRRGRPMCLPFVVRGILHHFVRTHRFAPSCFCFRNNLFIYSIVLWIKNNNGTEHFILHLRLCGKHWHDTRLLATGHHHHTHTQHKRHCPTNVPYDGNWRLCIHAPRVVAPPRYHMVNVHHQRHHMPVQLHHLWNKNIQRQQKTQAIAHVFNRLFFKTLIPHASPTARVVAFCVLQLSIIAPFNIY